MLCKDCQLPIRNEWPGPWCVPCWPELEPMPGQDNMTPFDLGIKDDLINIVRWAHNSAPRSKQIALGISEVGHPCERRIAYTMADIPAVNLFADPWPATVGTAVHSYMEQAVEAYQDAHGWDEWDTELKIYADDLIGGHTDLYNKKKFTVLDYKFPSGDNVKKMKKEGPSLQYRVQVHLYGLGHERAGRRVDRVGIVALGRQAWLKDLYVWTEPYDREFALRALQRVYSLGSKLIEMDIVNNPQLWADIPAKPDFICRFCPFYSRGAITTDQNGCPGA